MLHPPVLLVAASLLAAEPQQSFQTDTTIAVQQGTRGAVKAQTLEGNITVRGPAESVALTTVNGKIVVDGARGRMDLHSVSDDIEVSNAQGDVVAETVSGGIELRGVDGKSIDAQSVSGDLLFVGRILDGGNYSFLSHSGEITLGIPEGTNATISLASAMGDFSSSFPLNAEPSPRKRRQTFRLGSGTATVESETFNGEINLVRPGGVSGARRHRD